MALCGLNCWKTGLKFALSKCEFNAGLDENTQLHVYV